MTTPYKLAIKKPQILILMCLIAYPAIGALMFTPGLPQIVKRFQLSDNLTQMVMLLFLIGYAIGQLLYGPLANRYGRKPAIYRGIALAMVGDLCTILGGFFHLFPLLLIGRFAAALGSGSGLVLTYTIINDFYYHAEARRVLPYVVLSFAILPFLAITCAGFLVEFFGWESAFYVSFVYGGLLYLLCRRLPETAHHLDHLALKFSHIKQRYAHAFTDRRLLLHAVLVGHMIAAFYLVATTAPLIMIDEIGITPHLYGMLSLILSAGYLLGNILSAEIATFFSSRGVIKIGIGILGAALLPFMLAFLGGVVNLYTFYLPLFFVYLSLPPILTNAAALALTHFHDKPTAASTMHFISVSHAVVAVFLIGRWEGLESKSLPIALGITFLSLLFFFFLSYQLCHDLKGKQH